MPKQPTDSDWLRPSYLDAVEGLGDILVFVVSRNAQPETVTRCLSELRKPLQRIIANQDLAIADDFLNADEQTLGHALFFSPEDALKNFYAPLLQVVRGLVAAANAQNDEASLECLRWLRDAFMGLVDVRDSDSLLHVWLRAMASAADSVRRTDHPWLTSSLTHGWYLSELFQHFDLRAKPFILDYLQPLSDWVFGQVQRSIRADDDSAFRDFYSSLVDVVCEIPPSDVDPWQLLASFWSPDLMVVSKVCGVDSLVKQVDYTGKVAPDTDSYGRTHSALRSAYECVVEQLGEVEASDFRDKCRGTVLQLNHAVRMATLEELTFAVTAYAMHLREYDKVRGMLHYNQPQGATGTWLNREPLPDQVGDFVRGLVVRWLAHRQFDHFGPHLDGREAKTWSGGLLLARLCLRSNADPAAVQPIEWHPQESFFEPSRASDVGRQCDSIISTFETRQISSEEAEFVSPDDSGEAGRGIALAIAVLRETKKQAEDALRTAEASHPLSEDRMTKHRRGILKSLQDSSDIRRKLLAAHPELYVQDLDGPPEGRQLRTMLHINRGAFLDLWTEHPQLGHAEGAELARNEVRVFAAGLRERSQHHLWPELPAFLGQLDAADRWIAVAPQRDSTTRLNDLGVFEWRHSASTHEAGEFVVGDVRIPLFRMRFWDGDEGVVLVRLSAFGLLVQESPLDAEYDPKDRFGMFCVSYADRAPDELHVTVRVAERLTHRPGEDFESHFFAFGEEKDETTVSD